MCLQSADLDRERNTAHYEEILLHVYNIIRQANIRQCEQLKSNSVCDHTK